MNDGLGKNLFISFIIVILSAVIGLTFNALRAESLPLVQDWDETIARRAEKILPNGIPAVESARLLLIYQKENVRIIDARPKDFFLMEHIPGAVNIPLEQADELLPTFLGKTNASTRIITYCDGPSCPSARQMAEAIKKRGHDETAVFLGGMEEWTAHDNPVASGGTIGAN